MGKGARLRAARRVQDDARTPLEMLRQCVIAVGDAFGTWSMCVEAACVLQQVGELLGFDLEVRPVAVLMRDKANGYTAAMGTKAEAFLSKDFLGEVIDERPSDVGPTGHVVLTCADPLLLLDPNLRQVGRGGLDAPSIWMSIRSDHPGDGGWRYEDGNLLVVYLVDDEDRSLLENYDEVRQSWAGVAVALVQLVRAGATADKLLPAFG